MIVVKVGGSEGIDLGAVCRDIALLVKGGQEFVLVHGGSHRTNEVAEKLDYPSRFYTSPSGYTSRWTDRETLKIFEMVYCGEVNKGIVEMLQGLGVNALGLSGIDGRLLQGRRKGSLRVVELDRKRVLHGNFTGTVERVNVELLRLFLNNGYLPVISPPAISWESEAINVDGDRAAARIASALEVEQLIILSNMPGLLREFPDEGTLIERINAARVQDFMEFARGRMRIKVLAAAEAIKQGVGRVIFADGRVEDPVRKALAGKGTVIS